MSDHEIIERCKMTPSKIDKEIFSNVDVLHPMFYDFVHKTRLIKSSFLSQKYKNNIYLKLESEQVSGSFKFRGLLNYILYTLLVNHKTIIPFNSSLNSPYNSTPNPVLDNIMSYPNLKEILDEKNLDTISTYTTGNHGIAACYLSDLFGFKAKIFAPNDIPRSKIEKMSSFKNAELILTKTRQEAEDLARINGHFIHPSGNEMIFRGNASIVQELVQDILERKQENHKEQENQKELYAIFAPCGGGGLLSGIKMGCELYSHNTKVFGCEPLNANDAFRSKQEGKLFRFQSSPDTVADALKALSLSELSFEYIKKIDDIILSDEGRIMQSYIDLNKEIKCEISSAVVVSAFEKWFEKYSSTVGKNIVLVITGNNM